MNALWRCVACFCGRTEVKDEAESSNAIEGRSQSDTGENYAAYLTDKACTGTTVYLCTRLRAHKRVCVFDCVRTLEGRGGARDAGSLKQAECGDKLKGERRMINTWTER